MNLEAEVIQHQEGSCSLVLKGRIDVDTIASLENAKSELEGLQPKRLLVDMTEVDYISSSGIGRLFELTRQLKKNNGFLAFFGIQANVRKVLDIVKAVPLDTLFGTLEEADQYLSSKITL